PRYTRLHQGPFGTPLGNWRSLRVNLDGEIRLAEWSAAARVRRAAALPWPPLSLRQEIPVASLPLPRLMTGDRLNNTPARQSPLWVMCGRRLGKNFLTLLQHWSGAVMCPTCLCGGQAAGPNAMRGSGPNQKHAL